jgi:hypothetical protein
METEAQTPIYNHPTLRSLTHEKLVERLQQIRDRRLVAAIQYEAIRKTKVEKLSLALREKWEKQNDRNNIALAKIDEMIDKLDAGIAKQIQIAHDLTLTEQEFEL